MKISTYKDKLVLKLSGNSKSPYSIISLTILAILIACCAIIIAKYYPSPIKAMAFCFLPAALIVFMTKIVIWNYGGKETIIVKGEHIEVFYDYPMLYKQSLKTISYKDLQWFVRSNQDTNLRQISTVLETDNSKGIYKLHLKLDEKEHYQSSFSINFKEVLELKKELLSPST